MENQEEIIQNLIDLNNMIINQITSLTQENRDLKKGIEYLNHIVSDLLQNQKNIADTISKNQHEVKMLGETMTRSVDNVIYEIGMGKITSPKVASIEDTVEQLANNHASICRFGDGEFSIMMGNSRQPFQRQDDKLAQRLKEVLLSNEDKCLIAIADNYGSLNQYSNMSKNEIRYYMTEEVRRGHATFLDPAREYYNAYITTPYMLYGDHNTQGPSKRFQALKAIWDRRDIIVVEGRLSRLGVGNDLFSNTKSIRRILCPPEHAFESYDDIVKYCKEATKTIENPLFVIALGPTATVLAYDLFKLGFQAMDLGHIDNDYEYFLRKVEERCLIPGKYINNLTKVEDVSEIDDETYEKQIVKRI